MMEFNQNLRDAGHGDVIDDVVLVEVKAVERLIPIHTAQLLTYLKLTGYPPGC